MSTALVVVTDGRLDYLEQTLDSAANCLVGDFAERFIIDDSGKQEYGGYLKKNWPGYTVESHPTRRGLAGAVQSAWELVKAADVDFVFHLEEDFTFNRSVMVADLISVLRHHPQLAQMVLKRQPWNEAEFAAGGIIEANPDAYTQAGDISGHRWVEHREIFSLNPCVYPYWVVAQGWPDTNEAGMTAKLCADPGVQFGMWGRKFDAPWVTHIGEVRSAEWAL